MYFGTYKRQVPDIETLVQGFSFEKYEDVLIKELSTGNKKKVYLITAFALRPELLFLDEPVNGLDFQSTEFLYTQIKEYKEHGAVFFSSHGWKVCSYSGQDSASEEKRKHGGA